MLPTFDLKVVPCQQLHICGAAVPVGLRGGRAEHGRRAAGAVAVSCAVRGALALRAEGSGRNPAPRRAPLAARAAAGPVRRPGRFARAPRRGTHSYTPPTRVIFRCVPHDDVYQPIMSPLLWHCLIPNAMRAISVRT